jgi:hypothetical protein
MPRFGYRQTPEQREAIRAAVLAAQGKRRETYARKLGLTVEEWRAAGRMAKRSGRTIAEVAEGFIRSRAVLDRPGAETGAGGAVSVFPAPSASL